MKCPLEPNKNDCCNSGCNPCIFDVYEKQLQLYRRYLECKNDNSIYNLEDNGISQMEYTTMVIIDNIDICASHNILVLKSLNNNKIWWKPGDHFLFKYISENNVCTRAYTPVKIKGKTQITYDFMVIIKRYENGLVSNYLCDLKSGAQTLWRGPYGNYDVKQNKFTRIIMFAQGTGIAPLFSIIENILNDEDNMSKIILLYCCKTLDTILVREELYSFKSYWNFTYYIFLTNLTEMQVYKYQEPIINKRLCFKECEKLKPFSQTDQFLLCGSAQFMEEYNLWLLNKCEVDRENIQLF